jgi:hypothetical protein
MYDNDFHYVQYDLSWNVELLVYSALISGILRPLSFYADSVNSVTRKNYFPPERYISITPMSAGLTPLMRAA